MRRWRRDKEEDDDELLTFDELEDGDEDEDDEEEEEAGAGRRYLRPRPLRIARYDDFEDGESGPTFEDLEAKIRAGKYKPKSKDPWTAHVLYENLKSLGEI